MQQIQVELYHFKCPRSTGAGTGSLLSAQECMHLCASGMCGLCMFRGSENCQASSVYQMRLARKTSRQELITAKRAPQVP
eukprot:849972-Pelagomonas_calceolata.AAC.1